MPFDPASPISNPQPFESVYCLTFSLLYATIDFPHSTSSPSLNHHHYLPFIPALCTYSFSDLGPLLLLCYLMSPFTSSLSASLFHCSICSRLFVPRPIIFYPASTTADRAHFPPFFPPSPASPLSLCISCNRILLKRFLIVSNRRNSGARNRRSGRADDDQVSKES
ncbi:hypothetical protein M407DRAFT_114788 [Tulasnella calospora MUT 4182]|uniref:Uncharacterized protein n=1 Tax=Tulasnella calospora MUT 4182 TaxID=1051891 RepID=A0A0C3LNE1_9AGAM|nr:hypothetical protein M407DRAFT_114788 [Tulasnella calospora MUT 4182]